MNTQTPTIAERRPINLEQVLALLAFALALAVRFLNLGAFPLSDSEAGWALQSLALASSSTPSSQLIIGPQPAYIFLTTWLFALFGAPDFLARFLPALAGSLLVLVPFLFRRQLGRPVALIAAFGLALDPGLVTVSRQAGGPMMAVGFGLLALGLWNTRKSLPAGCAAGLALLSGPAVIQGGLGLAIAWLSYRLINRNPGTAKTDPEPGSEADSSPLSSESAPRPSPDPQLREAAIACALTILILGTSFFRFPQGLAAWAQSLVTYLSGWTAPSGSSPFTMLSALGIFQPLALIFAFLCIGRWLIRPNSGSKDIRTSIWVLTFWLFAGLILVLFYPARQVADLVWVLIPLWGLAAIELAYFLPETKPNIVSVLQAGLIILLAALFWNTLVSTNRLAPAQNSLSPAVVRLVLLLGIIMLGSLTAALIGLGWSWTISRNGLVWGIAATCLLYSVSVLWGATQLRPNQPGELWGAPPGTGENELLISTIEEMSDWNTGMPQYIKIQSLVDIPSLRWALHTFPDTQFISSMPSGELPPILITSQEQATAPTLVDAYRGQDFAWRIWPGWTGALPENFVDWLTFRQAPTSTEQIILWVRNDISPGAVQRGQN